MDVGDAIDGLRRRLRRFPADRYPVQHATAQFHLGVTLLGAGRAGEAVAALRAAADGFGPEQLPVEHAKALNMLGAALRDSGRAAEATDAFGRAAAAFEARGHSREQAAALFNLGLVHRETGDGDAALACFAQALRRFSEDRLPGQATAAARELGATLLARGEPEQAAETLQQAVDLASAADDQTALGAAANALGLARLSLDATGEAVSAFRTAAAAHPRGVRPEGFAMAKANLALAHEQTGDAPRARLAARQALGTPRVPEPVRDQAAALLERLDGPGAGAGADLLAVLDQEPADDWPTLVREELVWWADADAAARRSALGEWIDGQLRRGGRGPELAQAWLDVLLEQPPGQLERVVADTLRALTERGPAAAERFRADMARALARFPVPQWTRLRDTFNRLATELGQEPAWG